MKADGSSDVDVESGLVTCSKIDLPGIGGFNEKVQAYSRHRGRKARIHRSDCRQADTTSTPITIPGTHRPFLALAARLRYSSCAGAPAFDDKQDQKFTQN